MSSTPLDGFAELLREPVRAGPGACHYQGAELTFVSTWELTLSARIGDFDELAFEVSVDVD